MDTTLNPLASLAERLPARSLRTASVAGRLFGALLLVAVAIDQSYDPTQVFTILVAAAALATLVPLAGTPGDLVAALGAGLVFFAGAVLTHLGPGLGMLAVGLLAGLGAFGFAARNDRGPTLPGVTFVLASFLTAGLQATIVFTFE